MVQAWLKKNKIATIVLLGLVGSWALYALFGHRLIKVMYEGRSLWVLNRIIVGQITCPLEGYFQKADKLFFMFSILGIFSFIFLFSIWSGRSIPRKWFLCLIITLSLFQVSSFINFKNMDNLLIHDDHPKFYSITVENANLLLKHGTPFGFNHHFQGGIPTFYLRSCFLELIPFSFFLGSRLGYQVMLIFFIVLIPPSLFFLVLELVKNEDIAKLVSFLSAFQLGLWPGLYWGITPAIVAMPLSFFSIFFFLKYLHNKRCFLFPLLLFSGLLAYTHLVIFAITLMLFTMFFTYKLITQRESFSDLKKFICFGLFSFLICLPLCYNLFNYASFLRPDWVYMKEKTLSGYIFSIFLNIKGTADFKNILFLSTLLFLIFFYHYAPNRKEKLIIRNALIFSLIILFLCLLKDIPNIEIFIQRITWMFVPYIVVFNLSLFLLLKINRTTKIFAIIALLFIILNQYPLLKYHLETVNTVSEIDDEIKAFVSPGDFVLFENCAHYNPAKDGEKYATRKYSHWLTYLQRFLGVNFFSHMGNDAHPYNNLRHMYITNGFYKGEPLGRDNEKEIITLLKDWGVNKVCVWSRVAKRFFNRSRYFKLLGKSQKYTCFIATYNILPEVRLDKGGTGGIIDETPFSFTVYLQNISKSQRVIINKNYFNFWAAYNEKGDEIPLRNCNQKICFDVSQSSYVFFKYQKNALLNLISLLTLFFALILDIARCSRVFPKLNAHNKR